MHNLKRPYSCIKYSPDHWTMQYTHWKGGNRNEECVSNITRNSVFDCHLSPVRWQMAIKNSVSSDFWSTFVDGINIFDWLWPIWCDIGHSDLSLLLGQTFSHIEPSSETAMLIHPISLKNIGQKYWTMEYRPQWPIFIRKSNIQSYWTIIENCNVDASNKSLKYRAKALNYEMSYVQPAETLISLRVRTVWSEPLLAALIFYDLGYWPKIIWSF